MFNLTSIILLVVAILYLLYKKTENTEALAQIYSYWRVRARGAGLARGSHRLSEPAHLHLGGVNEHAGDVVPPRVSVDRAAGFIEMIQVLVLGFLPPIVSIY